MRRLSVDSLHAVLWPPRCVLCAGAVELQGSDPLASGSGAACSQDICTGCLHDLPWLVNACTGCGLPLPLSSVNAAAFVSATGSGLCGACLTAPLFTRCRVAFAYDYPVNQLVQALKFRRRRALARVLGYLLGLAVLQRDKAGEPSLAGSAVPHSETTVLLTPEFTQLPQLILPVPLHRWRLFMRGYNQAAEIAACLPPPLRQRLATDCCVRKRSTPEQTTLARAARAANVANAFALTRHGARRVPGKHVAVVDDVITTGATAAAMSAMLYAAGAARVEIWAVARTV